MSELREKHPDLAKLVDRLSRMFPGSKVKLTALIEDDGTERGAVTDEMRETARKAFGGELG